MACHSGVNRPVYLDERGVELFGLNEFALRVPHWLAGVVILVLIAQFTHVGLNALLAATVLPPHWSLLLPRGR